MGRLPPAPGEDYVEEQFGLKVTRLAMTVGMELLDIAEKAEAHAGHASATAESRAQGGLRLPFLVQLPPPPPSWESFSPLPPPCPMTRGSGPPSPPSANSPLQTEGGVSGTPPGTQKIISGASRQKRWKIWRTL